jgi:hypothetical protein
MQELSGFIAEFDRAMVLRKEVGHFGSMREELIALTVETGGLNHLEVFIGGFDDDNRSLYQIPEVRRWVQLLERKWPDLLMWLTPGSLWWCLLCLNPGMHSRTPDGKTRIALDTDKLTEQFTSSVAQGAVMLERSGLKNGQSQAIMLQALSNLMQTFERKKLGDDYVVIHPKSGTVLTCRLEN